MHLVEHNFGRYGFTATCLNQLESSEYTMIQILIDGSGSMFGHRQRVESMLRDIVAACQQSPHKDKLMLRVVTFGTTRREIHGFKMISRCDPAEYNGVIASEGMTALSDAILNGIEAVRAYAEYIDKQDYLVNGLLIVITDGLDNSSSPATVMNALARVAKAESLESFSSILIGIIGMSDRSSPAYKEITRRLRQFQSEVGFTCFVEVDVVDENAASRLAKFLNKAIHAMKDSLGTGGPPSLLQLSSEGAQAAYSFF